MLSNSTSDDTRRTAFVTGGTGFVGSHLVELLLESGFDEVRCLVRKELKYLTGMPVTIVRGTMSDSEALAAGVNGVQYVFHVAALTRAKTWNELYSANVEGTENLLKAIRSVNPNIRKVLVTSSLAAIGRADRAIATESTPMNPVSQYGKSKAQMEDLVATFKDDFPIVVVRPPAVYGPRETDIFTFFKSIDRGFCPIIGSGRNKELSLVHSRDLARGMLQAVLSEASTNETYFLSSPANYSWIEIRDATATALGKRVLTLRIPRFLVTPIGTIAEFVGRLTGQYPAFNREKAIEAQRACLMCDHSKAATDFEYSPEIDLWNGIQETIEWYRQEGWL